MKKYVLGPNAARRLKSMLAGEGKVGRRETPPGLVFNAAFAAPFTVRWAQSVNDGEGAWIVWLPGDRLVVVAGAAVDPRTDLEPVESGSAWYVIDDGQLSREQGGTLYLNVTTSGATRTATFANAPAANAVSLVVCVASVSADTGGRSVKQFVSSAVVIGGEGGVASSYFGDRASVANQYSGSTEGVETEQNEFQIKGFGRFTSPRHPAVPWGDYLPPSTLDLGSVESQVAFLGRVGNSSSTDANSIGYFRLRASGGSNPLFAGCFRFENSAYAKLKSCYYNVGGVTHHLSDQTVTQPVGADKFVCLSVTKSGGGVVIVDGDELEDAQSNPEAYLKPLYYFAGVGAPEDLRNAPQIQMVEIL